MPENVLNNTTNAALIPTIIATKALQRFPSYLTLAKNVSRDSAWVTTSQGATIQIPKTGAVVANDKVAGNVFTKQNPTATNVSVTLDQHKEVTFAIDDVTKVLENQSSIDRYADDGAIALAEAVESSLARLHTGITNSVKWDRTSATTIDNCMLLIRKRFTDQKVPKNEQKYMYVDSTVYNDLLGTDKFSRYDARGTGEQITTGQVIKAYGMEISESQLIDYTGSPGAYHNLAYTKNAFVIATRPLPAAMVGSGAITSVINDESIQMSMRTIFHFDADLGAHVLTLDLLYGVALIDQRRVIEVESF